MKQAKPGDKALGPLATEGDFSNRTNRNIIQIMFIPLWHLYPAMRQRFEEDRARRPGSIGGTLATTGLLLVVLVLVSYPVLGLALVGGVLALAGSLHTLRSYWTPLTERLATTLRQRQPRRLLNRGDGADTPGTERPRSKID